jgi:hypothetical protein
MDAAITESPKGRTGARRSRVPKAWQKGAKGGGIVS